DRSGPPKPTPGSGQSAGGSEAPPSPAGPERGASEPQSIWQSLGASSPFKPGSSRRCPAGFDPDDIRPPENTMLFQLFTRISVRTRGSARLDARKPPDRP